MKTRTLLLAAALMAVTAAPAYANSASFNCAYAKTPDEVTICNSQELTDLDATLAQLFFPLRNQMSDPQRQKFNAEEASWLRYRMSCGADTQCITNAYKGRIDVLENIRHVAALTKGRNPTPAGTPTTAAPYDTFSGVLISGQGDLVLNFKENGEFVEGAVFLPKSNGIAFCGPANSINPVR